MLRKTFFLIHILLASNVLVEAQNFKDNYQPISVLGDIQASEIASPNWESFRKMAKEKGMDLKKAKNLEVQIEKDRLKMLTDGSVYYHDELSKFAQRVLNELLQTEPSYTGKMKVYVTRYSSVNAISLPEGTIFLNVGLLAAMDNESQLAAVLSHEIAHIKKQHVIVNIQKLEKIKKEEENVYNQEGAVFRDLSFSRENEFEADAVGLSILTSSKYNANEMANALELLEHLDTNEPAFELEKLFNSEYFKIDTASISTKKVSKWLKKERNKDENAMVFGLVEDIYLTHPEIEKRGLALKEILKSTNYNFKGNENELEFAKIKAIAEFEILKNCFSNGNYVRTVYEGLRLLRKYPENHFVKLSIIKSLFWMSQLKEQDLLENTLEQTTLIPTRNFALVNLLMEKPDNTQFKKLMYGYTKSNEEKMKENEEYALQLCLATETYLGKEAANVFYRQFLTQFPSSNYKGFIAEKLK